MPPQEDTNNATGMPGHRLRWLRQGAHVVVQHRAQLTRYLLTSVAIYLLILLALYLLVDVAGVEATSAYVAVFLCAYIVEYTATLLFVFRRRHTWGHAARFVLYVVLFLGFSTLLFDLLRALGVHYLAAALLTSAVLMPLRFVSNRRWVYS
jgi:putative flippase GtrA